MSLATRPHGGAAEQVASVLLPPADPTLLDALQRALPEPGQLRTRALDRLALGHDASHYFLAPTAVVSPRDASDVGRLFAVSAARGVPAVIRAPRNEVSAASVTTSATSRSPARTRASGRR